MKSLDKILSSIAVVLIAGGTFMANAATPQTSPAVKSAASASSAIVSSSNSTSSKEAVSSVDDALKKIQDATNNGIDAVNKATQKGIDTVNGAASAAADDSPHNLKAIRKGYSIIDINNGCRPVFPGEADYEKCKNDLAVYGDDAGVVPPEQSKACQAAKAAFIAKQKASATQAPAK